VGKEEKYKEVLGYRKSIRDKSGDEGGLSNNAQTCKDKGHVLD